MRKARAVDVDVGAIGGSDQVADVSDPVGAAAQHEHVDEERDPHQRPEGDACPRGQRGRGHERLDDTADEQHHDEPDRPDDRG